MIVMEEEEKWFCSWYGRRFSAGDKVVFCVKALPTLERHFEFGSFVVYLNPEHLHEELFYFCNKKEMDDFNDPSVPLPESISR